MNWAERKVAVWGAARSGIAAANLLVDLGAEVLLSDIRAADPEGLDPRVAFHGGANLLAGADVLVPSPGIKPSTPAMVEALASGVQLMSEVELAASVATGTLVAITGTDGKSTTTEMIGAVCRAAGRPTVVAGNIGDPLSNRVRDVGEDGIIVAEISEFQLWSCGTFRPRVAVITNVADDHADYFDGDAAGCARAIQRVLQDMGAGDTAIVRADDPAVAGFAMPEGVQRVPFTVQETDEGWAYNGVSLTCDGLHVMPRHALPLPGDHNVANALAALATADTLGLPRAAAMRALAKFKGLPHRIEFVREVNGVRWYDDSKATNPHAAGVGLRAMTHPLVAITGGFDKGLDLAPAIEALLEKARHVVVMGTTADRTLDALAGRLPTSRAVDMQQAVELAAAEARSGEAVLLAPAASSFDQFRSYAHRGQVFQAAVRALPTR